LHSGGWGIVEKVKWLLFGGRRGSATADRLRPTIDGADVDAPQGQMHPNGYCLLAMSYQIRYQSSTTKVKSDETNPFWRKLLGFNKRLRHFKYKVSRTGRRGRLPRTENGADVDICRPRE